MAIPFTPWDEFVQTFRWRKGEHVAAIAPAGAGKTTLLRELLPLRKYSVFFATKPDDPLYHQIIRSGFKRVERFTDAKPWDDKIFLWPSQQKTVTETIQYQSQVFREALNLMVLQKGWTYWIDESKYAAEMLRLRAELTFIAEQLRSIDSTLIIGAQRPAWLPPSVLSNATHTFLWKSVNRDDALKLSDLGGVDAKEVAAEAKTLGAHEFLYIKTRGTESKVIRSQVNRNR